MRFDASLWKNDTFKQGNKSKEGQGRGKRQCSKCNSLQINSSLKHSRGMPACEYFSSDKNYFFYENFSLKGLSTLKRSNQICYLAGNSEMS